MSTHDEKPRPTNVVVTMTATAPVIGNIHPRNDLAAVRDALQPKRLIPNDTTAIDITTIEQRRPGLVRVFDGPDPQPPTMLVKNLLIDDDVNLFGGDGDAGKTTTLIHAAICIILRRPVFGTLDIVRTGPVVFLAPEDGRAIIHHHATAIMNGMSLSDIERERVRADLWIVPDELLPINLCAIADVTKLGTWIREANIQPAFFVADPIGNLIGGGDENSETVAQAVCDNLRRYISRPLHIAIGIPGHLRKPDRQAGQNAARSHHDWKGSAGWANHARQVWIMTKKKGGHDIVMLGKANRLQTGLEHHIRLDIEADPENMAHWLKCELTDKNFGAASLDLTPGKGRPLRETERRALKAVDDRNEPGRTVPMGEWRKMVPDIPHDTLADMKDRFIGWGLVAPVKVRETGATKFYNYRITDAGTAALDDDGWRAPRKTPRAAEAAADDE
jgi:hypothetical protein